MARIIRGELKGEGRNIGIVVSRWNRDVTEALLAGARRALLVAGVADEDVTVVYVPGAFEIGFALEQMAASSKFNALVALGCVVRGETAHFEYVSEAAMRSIREISIKYKIPIGCGVLTTETMEQAIDRSSTDDENKGSEATLAAIEMISVAEQISDVEQPL
jgi:6,7-dimethyl-8-ribityllumazine synthase